MGKSESAKDCKRHPNHKLLPGICPSCLRERLQQFHQSSIYSDSLSSFSSSSEFFSSGDSPCRRRHHHRRNASEMPTASTAPDFFGNRLKKSGSIGILAAAHGGGAKKKGGFWSRLLVRPKALYFHSQPKVSSREILG